MRQVRRAGMQRVQFYELVRDCLGVVVGWSTGVVVPGGGLSNVCVPTWSTALPDARRCQRLRADRRPAAAEAGGYVRGHRCSRLGRFRG